MTRLDTAVFAWLVIVMGSAAIEHARAWKATPPIVHRERREHALIAGFAAIYVTGYLAVLTGLLPVLVWSQWFRGLSLVVIPVVWRRPAVTARRRWDRDRTAAAQLVALSDELQLERETR